MIKILNLKLVIVWEYQNIKMFLQKVTQQIIWLLKKWKRYCTVDICKKTLMVKDCWNELQRFAKNEF